MDFSEFLGKMQRLLTDHEQGDLFGNKEVFAERSAKLCEDFLMSQGYSVGKPHKYPVKIESLDHLIKTFYSGIRNIFPRELWSDYDEQQDRAVAKALIEGRARDDCISYETALQQCGLIVQTVLDRTDVFRFEKAPNFGVFGQAEMKWVTDRAVKIINKQIAVDEAAAAERFTDKMTEIIEEKSPHKGFSVKELEVMTKKLEAQYGKKEK